VHEESENDFQIHIAGPPYVGELIRRSLAHDFWYFSVTAVILFGITKAAMFRSARVFLGMLATCTSAVLLTLLLESICGRKIGILTVNLGTIVFVIALSHLVYMTFKASPSSSYPIFRQHNGSVWPSSRAALSTSWQTSSSCRYWEVRNGKRNN
jgi:uncharacterized protein